MDKEQLAKTISNAEIGKSIIQKARDTRNSRYEAAVVAIADSLMEAIHNAERKIKFHEGELDVSKRRLAAIEAGEFTITENGFQFKDAELRMNEALDIKIGLNWFRAEQKP